MRRILKPAKGLLQPAPPSTYGLSQNTFRLVARSPTAAHSQTRQLAAPLSSSLFSGSQPTSTWRRAARVQILLGNRAFASRTSSQSHYEILGVGEDATGGEIKRAYLSKAKQWHPDVNKSPDADQRFKELAAAYQALSDVQRRADYDAWRSHQAAQSQYQAPGSGARRANQQSETYSTPPPPGSGNVDPFELFRAVLEELGAEQVQEYWGNVRKEASSAGAEAKNGNFRPAREFARKRSTLFAAVVVPTALVLRFPWLVAWTLRCAGLLATIIVGNPAFRNLVGQWAWIRWRMLLARASSRARSKQK